MCFLDLLPAQSGQADKQSLSPKDKEKKDSGMSYHGSTRQWIQQTYVQERNEFTDISRARIHKAKYQGSNTNASCLFTVWIKSSTHMLWP